MIDLRLLVSRTAAFAVLAAVCLASRPVRADVTSGPHVFVGEQYDISGGVIRAVSFPIVGGLVRPPFDRRYAVGSATLATRPDGVLLSVAGSEIDSISPVTGRVVGRLDFQPVDKNEFPQATQLHVDAAGRLYAAFTYQINGMLLSALAFYAPGWHGRQAPYAIVPLPARSIVVAGLATLGDAVYVSDFGDGAIGVYAPVEHPALVGRITGLHQPEGLDFDRNGELYVCSAGDGVVLALPPSERGPVKPDRTISASGRRLCHLSQQFFNNGNEMAVAGEALFVAGNDDTTLFELRADRGGPQMPLATIPLADKNGPWHAIDLSVGPL